MPAFDAWVATAPKKPFQRQKIEVPDLGPEEVEVQVEHCGLCHSDLSVLNNDWAITQYPAVLGHEVIGRIVAVGKSSRGLKVGQRVGIGWNSGSCLHCKQCRSGRQQLCAEAQPTIVGHFGGFASHVRAHWTWTIPIPEKINYVESGPLLCGGITVFNPLAMYAEPTIRRSPRIRRPQCRFKPRFERHSEIGGED
jgi:uncharacterized zinc-type alcohol dehydrogenase-like protein